MYFKDLNDEMKARLNDFGLTSGVCTGTSPRLSVEGKRSCCLAISLAGSPLVLFGLSSRSGLVMGRASVCVQSVRLVGEESLSE